MDQLEQVVKFCVKSVNVLYLPKTSVRYIADPSAAAALRKKKDSIMSDYEGLDQIVLTDMTTVPADTSACSAVTGGGGFRRNSRTMTIGSTPGWRSYSRAVIQLT